MRVHHLIKGLGRGGAEMLLLDAQRSHGADTELAFAYMLPWKDALVEPLREAGAKVVCLRAPGAAALPLAVRRMAAELRRSGADLLHCHLPVSGVVGRLAGRLAGVPVVYTEHNVHERYHRLTRWANLATWRLQDRVVAVSGEVAASIHRHAGDAVPVEVLDNGIPVDRFRPDPRAGRELRRSLGVAAEAPVVGTVAVFRSQKRLDRWLAAAARIRHRHPDARFLLVGDGPLADEVRTVVEERGLDDAVVWGGLQDDVRPWLAAMDLYLMSSDFEGMPLALLEAMAMKLPVVSTTAGGISEVVVEGETGHLVPIAGSPADDGDGETAAALAAAAISLLGDAPRRAAFAAAARRRVEERFSTRRMQERLADLYRRTLEAAR